MSPTDSVQRALAAGDVEKLVEIWCCLNPQSMREAAKQALSTFGTDEVVDAILRFVKSYALSRGRRPGRAETLMVMIGRDQAVEPLTRALQDEVLCEFAARSLVKIGDDSSIRSTVVEALEHGAADGDRSVKIAVANALGESGSDWAVDVICRLAGDEDHLVRRTAASLLGNSDTEPALQILAILVTDDGADVRLEAANSLRPKRRGHRREHATTRLDEIRVQGLSAALTDKDDKIRESAARWLGEFSAEVARADSIVTGAARALASATADPALEVRRAAIAALSRVGGPMAAETLVASLSRDSEVREESALALIRLHDTDEAVRHAVLALDHADPEVRIAVADAIRIDAAAGVSETGRLLTNTTYMGVIFEKKLQSIVMASSRLTADPETRVRAAASAALAAIGARLEREREEGIERGRQEAAEARFSRKLSPSSREWPRTERKSSAADAAVRFTAYHPTLIYPGKWHTLLVYVHLEEAAGRVNLDSQARLAAAEMEQYRLGIGQTGTPIQHGATIRIVPRLPNTRFNPTHVDLGWLEDWHIAEFRMQAHSDIATLEAGQTINGAIEFCVGPLLIGEVSMWALLAGDDAADIEASIQISTEVEGEMYSAIFPSYAHKDAAFVNRLENAYSLLNLRYLRDVKELRAGDEWRPRLLGLIDEADIFQLCWSSAARRSPHVDKEWRYALDLARSGFIKPIYWETPMPSPPEELEHLHFQYWDPL